MPSEAAKKRQAQKKGKRQAASRAAQKRPTPLQQTEKENGDEGSSSSLSEGACAATPSLKEVDGAVADLKLSARSCTGE